ncbi:MAG: Alg9-like mannosyltransferase family protein, partial [Myxococcaceae bacterium]|nr:Alg9-like mannosyltransferase family protein [Myxococcaceae bacterium]
RAGAAALAGLALPLAALGVADRLAWGSAFHSVRAYLQYNLVDDRARLDFGGRPAWFYLACLPLLVPAGAWLALGSFDRRRLGLAAATAAVYLAGMSAIAHKEFRFALVAVPLVTAALVAARPAWTAPQRRLAVALTLAQSVVALAVLYVSGYCQGEPMRLARWVGARPDLRELVLVNVAHPGVSAVGRDVPVWGDRRERRAATAAMVAARGGGWCPPGRYLVCDERRGACLDAAMRADGCAVVARRGRAVAIARTPITLASSHSRTDGPGPTP